MASVIRINTANEPGRGSGRRGPQPHKPPHKPDAVNRLIEAEVIPRLLVAHSAAGGEQPSTTASPIEQDDVERFAPLAVRLEAHELLTEVDALLERGVSAEDLLIDLLAPAARLLGEAWKEDRLDFIDVTMGLWRLQEVLREIAARAPLSFRTHAPPRSALFSPFPGDQHSFGTAMIDECFSRAGWETELMVDPSRSDLLAQLSAKRFDLVGLTICRDCHIAALPSLIAAVRNVSRNPSVRLMLGGPVLIHNPTLALELGADGTAATATAAVIVADRLVASPLRAAIA